MLRAGGSTSRYFGEATVTSCDSGAPGIALQIARRSEAGIRGSFPPPLGLQNFALTVWANSKSPPFHASRGRLKYEIDKERLSVTL